MNAFPTPDDLYIDTSIVVDALFDDLPNAATAVALLRRLQTGGTQFYTSQVTRLEVGEAVRRLATRQQLSQSLHDAYGLDRFLDEPEVRERWMHHARGEFERLIARLRIYELPFDNLIWRRSLDLIAAYNLRGNDAAHAATALEYGVPVFATNDDHFLRVRELDVLLVRDLPPSA